MAQSTLNTANISRSLFRQFVNEALAALATNSSGATAPATPYAFQFWADTTAGILKQRNAANNAWINKGNLAATDFGYLPTAGGSMAGGLNLARSTITQHATTMDLWALANTVDGTGSAVTITAIANAPQDGVRRTLYPLVNTVITDNAMFDVDGGSTYTTLAGDSLEFEAVTVSTYKVHIKRADGTAVVGARQIQPITGTVASSALTIGVPATSLAFRSATLTSGAVTTIDATPANLVVPSTATLGTVSAVISRLYVLAINNAGTVELAVVNSSGGNNLDETTVINTTAMSSASDSNNVIYSTTARTGVAFRVVGFIESTQATAGTWATAPSTLQGVGGNAYKAFPTASMVRVALTNGLGSTDTAIRRFSTVVTNQGSDITYADSASLGGTFTINTAGVYDISYSADLNAGGQRIGISLNAANRTTSIVNCSTTEVVAAGTVGAANQSNCIGATLFLPAGSVIRAQDDAPAGVLGRFAFSITRVS